ncbi:MAG: chemotaxis protein CheD [Verrucomicrobiia bacterium]
MASPTLGIFAHNVVVGLADVVVSNSAGAVLATYSLGSCLGVAAYDPEARVGGLLHAMLPDSNIDPIKAAQKPGMFVDTGVPVLIRAMQQMRADVRRMQTTVLGGAQIMDNSGFFNIGKRNYDALLRAFRDFGLRVHREDVGGFASRTMYLHIENGKLRVKKSGQTEEIIL